MLPASQGCFSTNWNSAEPASKRHTRISDTARVTSVVQSATQRALRLPASSSPLSIMMNSVPTSGRNVVIERMGQLAMSVPSPGREHEPGDERRDADQHGEGVMIEVAGLHAHNIARDVEHARRDAVRTEAVDQPAVALEPERTAQPFDGAHQQDVVDLVEVPLVEQEIVERLVLTRELGRNI